MRPAALLFGLPLRVGQTFALAVVLAVILRWTDCERQLCAIGPKEKTPRFPDIKVTTTKVTSDALAGLFIGTFGPTQFAKLSSGNWVSGLGVGAGLAMGRDRFWEL
jgi:ribose/xylose/arabinose/galactoside ABC-type transport system permease subunit